MELFSADRLRNFITEVFLRSGFSESHALLSADVLITADLRGIDSHGIARLSGYVRLIEAGRINPKPNLRLLRDRKSAATLDADGAIGLVSAVEAMKISLDKTNDTGMSWIGISNSNHFGIAAYHALLATNENFIGLALTNASPLVATANTADRMLGTNPICFAFPAGDHPPLVFDMATAAAANGKLEIAERVGKPIPEGWLITATGENTTDPAALKAGGSLLPLGSFSHLGQHKGYGLGAIVDLLSGVLPGAAYGPWVPPFVAFLQPKPGAHGKGVGHLVGSIDPDAFRPFDEYAEAIQHWIQAMKTVKPLDPQKTIYVHGEPEYLELQHRLISGIPLLPPVLEDLNKLEKHFNILI